MTSKQKAAFTGIVLAIATSAGAAIAGNVNTNSVGERVRAVEVRTDGLHDRLDRIERKLDQALERRNP